MRKIPRIKRAVANEASKTLVLEMVCTVRSATSTMNPRPSAQRKIHRLIPIPGYSHLKNCIEVAEGPV